MMQGNVAEQYAAGIFHAVGKLDSVRASRKLRSTSFCAADCYTVALATVLLSFTFDHVHPFFQVEPGAILDFA